MVGVAANPDSKTVVILGHGLTITEDFELSPGVFISSNIPELDLDATVAGCRDFGDYAAALQGSRIATFALRIEHVEGGKDLAIKAWNSLWLFHLLSAACRVPCFALYSVCDGNQPLFSAANPSPFVRPLTNIHAVTPAQLRWARRYLEVFLDLIRVQEFSTAIRSYVGAHFLPEQDIRIMLLWAGIEGLLSVDAELSRRLALYAALMLDGTTAEKAEYFSEVKKAYSVRSRAVHGSGLNKTKLEEGYLTAARILIGLIAKCVELGRVPSPSELDRLAVSAIVI